MAQIKVYTSDPGSDQRTGLGPVINVVEASAPLVSFGRGSRTALVFGSVVNDRGTTNTPLNVTVEELFTSWGGFQAWLGDGLSPEARSWLNSEVPRPVQLVLGRGFGRVYHRTIAPIWR